MVPRAARFGLLGRFSAWPEIANYAHQPRRLLGIRTDCAASADQARVEIPLKDSDRTIRNFFHDRHMSHVLVHAASDIDDGDVPGLRSVGVDDGELARPRAQAVWQRRYTGAGVKDAVVGVRCTAQDGRSDASRRRCWRW